MVDAWTFAGESPSLLATGGTVTLVDESTFCLSGRGGDVHPGTVQGLFVLDTRVLSRFELTVDGASPEPLAVSDDNPFSATFVSRVRRGTSDHRESPLLVIRRRYVGGGMREDLSLRNHSRHALTLTVRLSVESDFADLFAVKEDRVVASGERGQRVAESMLELVHRDGELTRVVTIRGSDGAVAEDGALVWRELRLAAGEHWQTCVSVGVAVNDTRLKAAYTCDTPVDTSTAHQRIEAWRRTVPLVESDDVALDEAVAHSLEDLGSLRLFDPDDPSRVTLAAGAPWFMTLFGRDSLIAAYFALIADPDLALGVLQTLAKFQGTKEDSRTEEQPGRILHEVRFQRSTSAGLSRGDIYYGTVDATPLFVVLLGELRRWGLRGGAVDALLPNAERALEWIERYGRREGDEFVWYERHSDDGLVNQGWKDSPDAVTFADGTIAEPPIALAEVQGYVYAAYLARARFAEEAGDSETFDRYCEKASSLKRAFEAAFWLPDRRYYAMALDGQRRPVDGLASNMGHCLWAGIVDDDRAKLVAEQLLEEEMFSGWGVRTLATSMASYDPMSYHCGSVWPHDNGIIASGLMRYGLVDEALCIMRSILDAARASGGRLPELFSGMSREDVAVPVPYPASCSPQAWAAATPLQFIRLLLRLDPRIPHGELWLDPVVPPEIEELVVKRIPVGTAEGMTVRVVRGRASHEGEPEGVRVIAHARPHLSELLEHHR